MTLSGAGDQRLGDTRFKIVILDEASQATEPSTLIPLVMALQAPGFRIPAAPCVWSSHFSGLQWLSFGDLGDHQPSQACCRCVTDRTQPVGLGSSHLIFLFIRRITACT